MQSHHDNIPWDGIWIDMSEVSSFCVGSCGTGNLSLNPVHPPFGLPGEPGSVVYGYPEGFNLTNATEAATATSLAAVQASSAAAASPPSTATTPYFSSSVTPGVRNVNQPPYVINNIQGDLAVHAVSPNATHADGVEEYDVHSLFGHQILNATYQALLEIFPGKRPFIIGRSTFAGSGKWAGHWGGDNTSLFAYMYFSISQALSFSLFGVDTCGFNGNSDEELCNRWMQLSAFFPFYRNHNVLSANSQEAYVWASVAEASRTAMAIRYSLLPYMYTLFYYASTTGSTVMRALAWEFPNDPTLAAIDNQFLLGPALLITPVLGQGLVSAQGVFPGIAQGEVWYDWYTQEAVSAQPGENVTIPAPLGHIPVFVRGGYVLPQQEALYTTTESRNSSWSLLCALSKDGTASGQVYIDDGASLVPPATLLVDFTASNGSLWASARGTYEDTNALANVTIMGVSSKPSTVTLNGQTISEGVSYNGTVLSVKGLQTATSKGAWAQDWVLSWESDDYTSDEAKPECKRCMSTGRKCDGYSSLAFSRRELVQATASTQGGLDLRRSASPSKYAILPRLVSDPAFSDVSEKRYFQFFRHKTVESTNSLVGSRFWSRLVLQIVHTEPAIKHAVLALSALHQYSELPDDDPMRGDHLAFTEEQHRKALTAAKVLVASASEEDLDRVLAACVIFICYEGIRGDYAASRTHICYVHMPSSYLQDVEGDDPYDPYNVSMFFWYFEARVNPREAPTAIYLAGGAGQSSMYGAASDGGPCTVMEDSNSTSNNEWSMNTFVNMLYIDQPVGVGFSYDMILNSTFDTLFLVPTAINDTGVLPFEAYNGTVPEANSTLWYGSFPSQDILHTANTSALAARTLWHFGQAFFGSFTEHKTCNKDITIWGNSYGGYWVPTTAAYFVSQNDKIRTGELNGSSVIELPIDTIGFTNGCVDLLYQAEFYPQMAYNNTYGLQVINETVYEAAMAALPDCLQLVRECRSLSQQYDPDQFANNETVNAVCNNAVSSCAGVAGGYGIVSNRSDFDMGHMKPDPFPPYYLAGYFDQAWVQEELGAPVNFTQNSNLVSNARFRDAGYEYIHTNHSYSGGVVRQNGNLSFSRVFDSGHDVAAYQPETNFQIFNRAVFNKDIATGRLPTNGRFNDYSTTGPSSSFSIKNKLPDIPDPICYLFSASSSCTLDQFLALQNGSATVVDFVVTSPSGGGGPIKGDTL
ncbi:hypothetical protein B0A55_04291 [Friedmanniomyces simplex]|uniref:alpha-glucosidase n=1 Tax=Friedmanniomyces simplex TaxID=329884 RepID=A0A4U0WX07_9PEZI|nr:hypothetical protein B0A55_04291 [Friedmanniomyces simplex]